MTDDEEKDHRIRLYRGVSIEKIDRENKFVTDSNGVIHSRHLLIATGSRAALFVILHP
jgi:ferredoxin-nitrate reductase